MGEEPIDSCEPRTEEVAEMAELSAEKEAEPRPEKEARGELENTLIVASGDHGIPVSRHSLAAVWVAILVIWDCSLLKQSSQDVSDIVVAGHAARQVQPL